MIYIYFSNEYQNDIKEELFVVPEIKDPLKTADFEIKRIGKNDGDFIFTLNRPFMNQYKAYKEEEIEIALFSNKSLGFSVRGGGEGWYSSLDSVLARRERYSNLFRIALGLLLLVYLSLLK